MARGILILFLILEEKLLLVSMMLAVRVPMWISFSWTFSFIFYLFFNIQLKGIGFLKHSPTLVELILGFSPIILLMYWVTVFDFQNITSFHCIYLYQFSSVQSLSCVWLFATPWITACQASLSITNSWNSLRLTSIESVMPSSQHHSSKASILQCSAFFMYLLTCCCFCC